MKKLMLIITAVLMVAAITSCSTAPDMAELAVPAMPQAEMIPCPPASLADAPAEQREWIITVLDRYEALADAWAARRKAVVLALLPCQVEAYLMADTQQPEAPGK